MPTRGVRHAVVVGDARVFFGHLVLVGRALVADGVAAVEARRAASVDGLDVVGAAIAGPLERDRRPRIHPQLGRVEREAALAGADGDRHRVLAAGVLIGAEVAGRDAARPVRLHVLRLSRRGSRRRRRADGRRRAAGGPDERTPRNVVRAHKSGFVAADSEYVGSVPSRSPRRGRAAVG